MLKRIRSHIKNTRSFTIIEVLIASAIMGMSSSAIFASINTSLSLVNDVCENMRAYAVIQEKTEELRKRFFVQLPSGTTSFSSGSFSELNAPSGSVNIDSYSTGDIMRAVVTVTWTDRLRPSRQKTKSAVTLITRNGINYI